MWYGVVNFKSTATYAVCMTDSHVNVSGVSGVVLVESLGLRRVESKRGKLLEVTAKLLKIAGR